MIRLLFWWMLALGAHAQVMPDAVSAALARARLPSSALSVVIEPVGGGGRHFQLNAHRPSYPASLMKWLTSYAALDLLGANWQWTTELRAVSPPVGGVLYGDLYWLGRGDPQLTMERVWLLLRDLRLRGVREIRGDLVVDRSFFVLNPQTPLFDDDGDSPDRPYLVTPDAALLNYKALRLLVRANEAGVEVLLDPPLPQVQIVDRLQIGSARDCSAWRKAMQIEVVDRGSSAQIVLSGSIPAGCAGERYIAALNHVSYSGALIRQLWTESGGVWQGGVRQDVLPAQTILLAQTRSSMLPQMLRDMNKFSNNLMARQLYLTLGAVLGQPEDGVDTESRSVAVLRRWMVGKGWDWPELQLENGSGLSRHEQISARHLADLLQDVARSPLAAELIAAQPIAGVDGTMRRYGGAAAGRAHIKTGSLKDVRAIAGFVHGAEGRLYIVVAILNHPRATAGKEVLDAVLERAADDSARR